MPEADPEQPRMVSDEQLERLSQASRALSRSLRGTTDKEGAGKRYQAATELAKVAAEIEHTAMLAAIEAGVSYSRLGELAGGLSKTTIYTRAHPPPSTKGRAQGGGIERGL